MSRKRPGDCPFCGARIMIASTNAEGNWYVVCILKSCLARGPVRTSSDDAVTSWNVGAKQIRKAKRS